jgi:hypothetical protein
VLSALATNFWLYYLAGERLDRWDPNVFLAALTAGVVALVVVSLLTRPEPAARVKSFFDRMQTSSDTPSLAAAPGRAGEDSEAPRPLLLVNILRLRSAAAGRGWRAFAEDLGGLAVGFAMVATLVAATALLLAL